MFSSHNHRVEGESLIFLNISFSRIIVFLPAKLFPKMCLIIGDIVQVRLGAIKWKNEMVSMVIMQDLY
jgi:hypothetical protein